MKKLILALLFVLILPLKINSGPFIRFETGPSLRLQNVFFVEAIIGYKFLFWKHFESQTYGGWLTWAESSDYNFLRNSPFMDIYSLNQKFFYKKVFLHYKHYCAHPVVSRFDKTRSETGALEYGRAKTVPYWWIGTVETLSIGFEYEWK